MRIIVTGASGQFGSAAVQGLLGKLPAGDLILVTRNPDKLAHFAALGADVRHGDFDDARSLETAFAGGDKMLMISTARVGKRMPQHTNAVTAAVKAGVKHIVYTSFVAATPDNPSLAVKDHCGTEQLLRDSGVDWTVMRNSHYQDAIVHAIAPMVLKTGRWMTSSGDGKVACVTRQDCVDCAVVVLSTPGHRNTVYNVTGPELLSLQQDADILAEVSGKPLQLVHVTDDDMYAYFDGFGIPREAVDDNVVEGVAWSSDDMVSFERTIREGRFAVISDDVRKLTGRAPQSLHSFAMENRGMLTSI